MSFMLKYFSCEILHEIFDYLKVNEIFESFINVDPDVNPIIISYQRVDVDFESMNKSTFEIVLDYLNPEQIRSMVLSNSWSLTERMERILFRFHLSSMVHMTKLKLNNFDNQKLISLLFDHLENHPSLEVLHLTNCQSTFNKRNSLEIADNLSSLTNLKVLTFPSTAPLTFLRRPLKKLTRIKISECRMSELEKIFQFLPKLTHLDIQIPHDQTPMISTEFPAALKKLRINSSCWSLFDHFENIFPGNSSIESLILQLVGEARLTNAREWEKLIRRKLNKLKEFQLSVTLEEDSLVVENVLKPFENSFWFEKNVQMGAQVLNSTNHLIRLFSVPFFAPNEDWFPLLRPSPDISIRPFPFEKYIRTSRVHSPPNPEEKNPRFENLDNLFIEFSIDDWEVFKPFYCLSSLRHLKIKSSTSIEFLDEIVRLSTEKLQILTISNAMNQVLFSKSTDHDDFVFPNFTIFDCSYSLKIGDPEKICKYFPQLERISVIIKHSNDVLCLMNGLKHLRTATFQWRQSQKRPQIVTEEWLEENDLVVTRLYQLTHNSLRISIE